MKFIGKRIRNIDKYLSEFRKGDFFYIGLTNINAFKDEMSKYGFDSNFKNIQKILPRPIGKQTDFNANGKWIVDKSLPMEERVFESAFHIVDWHGNDHYGTRYYTRKCYKRELKMPPYVELTCENNLVISPKLEYTDNNIAYIKHIINMFLEMYGECETLTELFAPKNDIKVERLSWHVLPKGEYPWEKAKEFVEKILKITTPKHRIVISERHKVITNYIPDFIALGDQGFFGYIVYGFKNKNIYIFESNKPDNATYIFENSWKDVSRLTKADILNNKLSKARLIHNKNWKNDLESLIIN